MLLLLGMAKSARYRQELPYLLSATHVVFVSCVDSFRGMCYAKCHDGTRLISGFAETSTSIDGGGHQQHKPQNKF